MKAISLWQPWASAIAMGLKSIETRSWSTSYRGLLVIHAAKRWTKHQDAILRESTLDPLVVGLPLGAIIAVGRLVDCRPVDQLILDRRERRWGDYSAGRFGWTLTHVERLREPIPFIGRQGLFTVPLLVEDAILAQLSKPDSLRSETSGGSNVTSA